MSRMQITHTGTDDENQTSKPGAQNPTRYSLATPPNQKSPAAHLLLKWTQGQSMEGYTAQLLPLLGIYLGFLGILQPLDATHFIALMLTEKPPFQFCASVWLTGARAPVLPGVSKQLLLQSCGWKRLPSCLLGLKFSIAAQNFLQNDWNYLARNSWTWLPQQPRGGIAQSSPGESSTKVQCGRSRCERSRHDLHGGCRRWRRRSRRRRIGIMVREDTWEGT